MKRVLRVMSIVMAFVMCLGLCIGCGAKESKAEYTITFVNGETQLGTVTVKEGEVLDAAAVAAFETQENYEFNGWYGTPSFMEQSAYDIATATFTEDITVFGNFISTLYVEDTRSYYIVGDSKKGGVLKGSGWAGSLTDEEKAAYQLTRVEEGKNTFAITMDMYEGDEFQVIIDWKWDNQHGFGYVAEPDESILDTSNGAGLSDSLAKKNISIKIDGNYTITLNTDMENMDRDTIVVVRNGDATVAMTEGAAEESTAPTSLTGEDVNIRVKGSWKDDWSDVKVLENTDGSSDWTITMDLDADTELCFAGYNGDTDTGIIMKEPNVTDDASKALLVSTGNNIKIKETGSYTFTVSAADLSVKITKN